MNFSIITPSWNGAKYLKECLDSVQLQKGVSLEHIVIDNFSTDDTSIIVRNYPNITFIQAHDSGMSEAINHGFRLAKGNWVMWLNTDDRLLPNSLEKVKKFILKNPAADVIHCGWNFMDVEGNYLRKMKALPFNLNMLLYYGCYIASTALFLKRKTTIEEGFYVNEKFKYIMDGEYYARLGVNRKKFLNFKETIADFRLHPNALSARNDDNHTSDAILKREWQTAESQAIRRMYGLNLFKVPTRNMGIDSFLYELYRIKKGWMSLIN